MVALLPHKPPTARLLALLPAVCKRGAGRRGRARLVVLWR